MLPRYVVDKRRIPMYGDRQLFVCVCVCVGGCGCVGVCERERMLEKKVYLGVWHLKEDYLCIEIDHYLFV